MLESELLLLSDEEIAQELAYRAKRVRLHLNISQEDFAKKSGLSYATYGKFERTGKISLVSFLTVMRYLKRLKEISTLLELDDVEKIGLENYAKMVSKKDRQRAH